MNKLCLGTVFFVLLSFSVQAQKFKAGIIAGVSATQISGDRLSGYNKAGLVLGGVVSTAVAKKFDLAMEILYFQKGSKKNSDPENGDYTSYRLRLNYFEVPLLLQWNYSKVFTFEGGPTFGALLSDVEEDEYGVLNAQLPFEKMEFGIAGGLKVRFAQKFAFTARIESSLLPVRKHVSGASYRLNHGQYNAALQFAVQYIFGKKDE